MYLTPALSLCTYSIFFLTCLVEVSVDKVLPLALGCVYTLYVCLLGLLWQLRPSDVEVELLAHTRNVISKDLEEETGLHTGWIQNGGLFIASNKQRLDEYKRLMSVRMIDCFFFLGLL